MLALVFAHAQSTVCYAPSAPAPPVFDNLSQPLHAVTPPLNAPCPPFLRTHYGSVPADSSGVLSGFVGARLSTCAPGLPRHCGAISPNAVLQSYAPDPPSCAPLFIRTLPKPPNPLSIICTLNVRFTCLRFHVGSTPRERVTVSPAVYTSLLG